MRGYVTIQELTQIFLQRLDLFLEVGRSTEFCCCNVDHGGGNMDGIWGKSRPIRTSHLPLDVSTEEARLAWKEHAAKAVPKTSRADWRVLFHPCPASFGVYFPLPSPYILELFTGSGSKTSRHYLAGVSQNTLPVI
jgi:hypothetical protein